MKIQDRIAVVTGAGSGIGRAIAARLAHGGARAVAMVDRARDCASEADAINRELGGEIARAFCGDVCDAAFRAEVFARMERDDEPVRICVPAAGVLRDAMAVKVNRDTGRAELYDDAVFREVLEINLLHPVYWSMQMIARIAERRAAAALGKWQPSEGVQGASVLIGSVSSRGNRGQISYSCAKSALAAAAKTLDIEGMFHGVQAKIVHPGMVDTPMMQQLPAGHFEQHYQPQIRLGRMITPAEIAEAVAVLIENPAISGPLWADAGLTPMA
ncbi:MAG: SDR family NAD(P)-dependent oxidoreductase [bacterium]